MHFQAETCLKLIFFCFSTLQVEKDRKSILSNVVYKDIKPRVDTRWRKNETNAAVVAHKPTGTTKSYPAMTAITRPLSRQSSKGSDMMVKKEKTVKSITESIASQIKKTTTITAFIDSKKDPSKKKKNDIFSSIVVDIPFIRSPQSMKVKEKTQTEKFFESHSTHLLHQVDNIDEKDKNNIQMISEYANDIYAYLMRLENMYAIRSNFLEHQMDVTPKMRSVLLDWINEVHHQFNLEVETFHMTVSMIDRYLQSTSSTPRKHLQLVGVTALFMASKYEEMMPPEINDFVYVTDDTYSKRQILQMEMKIFKALDFNLCKPLPIHFLRRYLYAAGNCHERQYLAAKYFIELATIDYELTSCKPSEVISLLILKLQSFLIIFFTGCSGVIILITLHYEQDEERQ